MASSQTLWVLTLGVLLAIFFETMAKLARSRVFEQLVDQVDQKLAREVYTRFLAIRLDQLPRSVGSLAAQLKGYETVRGFLTSVTSHLMIDVPFALLFLLVIASQFIPAAVVVLPYFLMFKAWGLLDTKLALVLVNLSIVLPYAIWMIKGFLDAVPMEIEEAAMVDGASRLRVIGEILVPAAWPGIVTAAVFSFTLTWNEFLFALILGKQHALTLPIGLIGFRTERGDLWELMAAGGLLITLPMFVLSLLVQKHFVGSLTAGSVR